MGAGLINHPTSRATATELPLVSCCLSSNLSDQDIAQQLTIQLWTMLKHHTLFQKNSLSPKWNSTSMPLGPRT